MFLFDVGTAMEIKPKKTLVLSGINLFEGGPLSIYYDILDNILACGYTEKYSVTAFVHKLSLFEKYKESPIEFIELPQSRESYINRLRYEYGYFKKYSKSRNVDVWFSVHDMTPSVRAGRLYTYCHNSTPFVKFNASSIKFSLTVYLFSLFYKYLYRINIKKATGIIVQQDWLRKGFRRLYGIKNIIVAHPDVSVPQGIEDDTSDASGEENLFVFPTLPRHFKNVEVICEAARALENKGITNFSVAVTLDGSENSYTEFLLEKYGDLKCMKWLGRVPRERVFELFRQSKCLIFPSRTETWGLPITEYKQTGKPIILADLPYAHETLGTYDKARFFDPDDAAELSELMLGAIDGTAEWQSFVEAPVDEPFCQGWRPLLSMLLD